MTPRYLSLCSIFVTLVSSACSASSADDVGAADARIASASDASEGLADGNPGLADGSPGQPDADTTDAAVEDSCLVEDSYPGTLFDPIAFEGNPSSPQLRFMALNANLQPGSGADRLRIIKFYAVGEDGYPTGTFELPFTPWEVLLCADYDPGGVATCQRDLRGATGTLRIDEAGDRLVGTLTDVTFVDERDDACQTSVASIDFDQAIEDP